MVVRVLVALFAALLLSSTAHAGHINLGGESVPEKGARTGKTKVLIIKFGDFQCPYCERAAGLMDTLVEEYRGEVTVAYMHNALPMHRDARDAAIAAVAAQRQGKFWALHGLMYDNPRTLKSRNIAGYAVDVGLRTRKFTKDLKDKRVAAFVDLNQAIAVDMGVRGTPSFLVNGKILKGFLPIDNFRAIIDEEISAANRTRESGPSWVKKRFRLNSKRAHGLLFRGKKPAELPKVTPRKRDPSEAIHKVTVDPGRDAWWGDKDALVTLVVFSEYQCPFCARLEPTLAKIRATYGTRIRIVRKHNPLPFHKEATGASVAAMCAQDQNRFWEMDAVLFANQRALGATNLPSLAEEAGVQSLEAFESCLDANLSTPLGTATQKSWAGPKAKRIEADQELAAQVMARGTPNTFINGRKLTGAKPFDAFKAVIDEEFRKAESLVRAGTPRRDLYAAIIAKGKLVRALEEKVNTFDTAGAARMGPSQAPIQLVVFADFQCPFSGRVAAPLKAVLGHYGATASLVYMNFPLSFHKQAAAASNAALCAKDQGQFWEMHELLFADPKALPDLPWSKFARRIGLNMRVFRACMESSRHEAQIEREKAQGRAAKVRGTPSLYINGRKFNSPSGYNLPAITKAIDKYILPRGPRHRPDERSGPDPRGKPGVVLGWPSTKVSRPLCERACANLERIAEDGMEELRGRGMVPSTEDVKDSFVNCPTDCQEKATAKEAECMIKASDTVEVEACGQGAE